MNGSGVSAARSSAAERIRAHPLATLLVACVLLRVATIALYFPQVAQLVDIPRMARADGSGLFDDYWMPAGYAAILKVLHHASDTVIFPIVLQHLVAIGLAALAFRLARRAGLSTALALIASAIIGLNGDLLYLEHQLMADFQMFTLAVLACLAVGESLTGGSRRWLLAAGGFAAASGLTRSFAVALIPMLALVTLSVDAAGWRERLLASGRVLLAGALVVALYLAAFAIRDGRYTGLGDMRGWNLYARVAPFAKCSSVADDPKIPKNLCDPRNPAQRLGPFYYSWDPASPSRGNYALGPQTGKVLDRFAMQVIKKQPLDYLHAVSTDTLRFIEPSWGRQAPGGGQGDDLIWFGWRDRATEKEINDALALRYSGVKTHVIGLGFLRVYERVFRVPPIVTLASLLSILLCLVRGRRGPARTMSMAFGSTGAVLAILPAATLSYDYRYDIPVVALVALGGVFAMAALAGGDRITP